MLIYTLRVKIDFTRSRRAELRGTQLNDTTRWKYEKACILVRSIRRVLINENLCLRERPRLISFFRWLLACRIKCRCVDVK